MGDPLLHVRDLHAGYSTAEVLRGLSVDVRPGEVHALLGRNGSGKTTLFRAVCGLTPPSVTTGSIRHAGREILGRPSYRIARDGVALVPQGRRLFASLTVRENLQIAARSGARSGTRSSKRSGTRSDGPGGDAPWREETIFEIFPRLAERAGHLCRVLSGGEQQMVAIGRALIGNPDTLLLDEPTEGLAPVVQDVILDRLGQLKGTALAVLLAEQNVDFALGIADRVSVLGDDGVIVWTGTAADISAHPGMLADLVGLGEARA